MKNYYSVQDLTLSTKFKGGGLLEVKGECDLSEGNSCQEVRVALSDGLGREVVIHISPDEANEFAVYLKKTITHPYSDTPFFSEDDASKALTKAGWLCGLVGDSLSWTLNHMTWIHPGSGNSFFYDKVEGHKDLPEELKKKIIGILGSEK